MHTVSTEIDKVLLNVKIKCFLESSPLSKLLLNNFLAISQQFKCEEQFLDTLKQFEWVINVFLDILSDPNKLLSYYICNVYLWVIILLD